MNTALMTDTKPGGTTQTAAAKTNAQLMKEIDGWMKEGKKQVRGLECMLKRADDAKLSARGRTCMRSAKAPRHPKIIISQCVPSCGGIYTKN